MTKTKGFCVSNIYTPSMAYKLGQAISKALKRDATDYVYLLPEPNDPEVYVSSTNKYFSKKDKEIVEAVLWGWFASGPCYIPDFVWLDNS